MVKHCTRQPGCCTTLPTLHISRSSSHWPSTFSLPRALLAPTNPNPNPTWMSPWEHADVWSTRQIFGFNLAQIEETGWVGHHRQIGWILWGMIKVSGLHVYSATLRSSIHSLFYQLSQSCFKRKVTALHVALRPCNLSVHGFFPYGSCGLLL